MIEILVLYFLTKHLGKVAEAKGYNPKKYKILTIVLWFGMEIIGGVIGMLITEEEVALYVFALVGAAIGAIISNVIVKNLKPIATLAEDPAKKEMLVKSQEDIPKQERTMKDSLTFYGFLIVLIGIINIASISVQTNDTPVIGLILVAFGFANVIFPILSGTYLKHIHLINFLVLVISGILWIINDTSSVLLIVVDLVVLVFGIEQLFCFLKNRSILFNIKQAV